ncbi:MAG: hypothetical protein R6U96_16090 [Promethearchaeia archaeon]
MKLLNNALNRSKKITGFTKENIIAAKRTIERLQESEEKSSELEEYLEDLLPQDFLDQGRTYLSRLREFIDNYIRINQEGKEDIYFFIRLKNALMNELSRLSSNLLNFKLNSQNIKRFLKQKDRIEEKKSLSKKLQNEAESLRERLADLTSAESTKKYDDRGYIWKEVNQIKKSKYRLIKEPQNALQWDEVIKVFSVIKDIEQRINEKEQNEEKSKKRFSFFRKKKEKPQEEGILFPLGPTIDKLASDSDTEHQQEIYEDILYLLYVNGIIKESQYSQVDKSKQKQIKQELKIFFDDLIKTLIKDYLEAEIEKVKKFDQEFDILSEEKKFNVADVDKLSINEYLPRIFKHYFEGIEMHYQHKIDNLREEENFDETIQSYQNDMAELNNSYKRLNEKIEHLSLFSYPYQEIIEPIRKILENIEDSIERRQETYIDYLKTLRTEKIRENARKFIDEKKKILNSLIDDVKEKTSTILHGEFPQLKKMQLILEDYRNKIAEIKKEVYSKLDTFKENNVDMYQQIKTWEKNLNIKQSQLNFIISMIFKRLYKNFKGLIDSEGMLFDSSSDLIEEGEEEALPINFALSNFLIDKLTEQELKDRISQVKTNIKKSERALRLYKSELEKLEAQRTEKVKKREGIDSDELKCTVCRQKIKVGKDKIIVCPFCKNAYHYLCVADWINKYNSCPTCQNQFLDPNSGLYQVKGEN